MVAHSRAPVRVDRLRALNRPRRVDVELNERGLPRVVTSEDEQGRAKTSTVETIGEVWRVDDEWWRQPLSRRYVEVVLQGGGHLMLFEDLTTSEWFAQDI